MSVLVFILANSSAAVVAPPPPPPAAPAPAAVESEDAPAIPFVMTVIVTSIATVALASGSLSSLQGIDPSPVPFVVGEAAMLVAPSLAEYLEGDYGIVGTGIRAAGLGVMSVVIYDGIHGHCLSGVSDGPPEHSVLGNCNRDGYALLGGFALAVAGAVVGVVHGRLLEHAHAHHATTVVPVANGHSFGLAFAF